MDEPRKLRSWRPAERLPDSLLNLNPAVAAELESEYTLVLNDLIEHYNPVGVAEQHCLEMMAVALWCERRAVSAEKTALNLDAADMAQVFEHGDLAKRAFEDKFPDGLTAAEQTALSINRVLTDSGFYRFLLHYKRTQAALFESALRRLERLQRLRRQNAQPPVDDIATIFGQTQTQIQNEPRAA